MQVYDKFGLLAADGFAAEAICKGAGIGGAGDQHLIGTAQIVKGKGGLPIALSAKMPSVNLSAKSMEMMSIS